MSAGSGSSSDSSSSNPVPGRARTAGATYGAFVASYGQPAVHAARTYTVGLKPGVVTSTSKPDRIHSKSCSSSTYPCASQQVSHRCQQQPVSEPATRHVGAASLCSVHQPQPQRHRSGTASLDDSIRSSSRSKSRAGFDAVAAEQYELKQQSKQQHKVPMFEPLTFPGRTAKPHHTKSSSVTARTTPDISNKASHTAAAASSSNGLCGIGSPTINGFLSSLERRKRSTAAAAAEATARVAASSDAAAAGASLSAAEGAVTVTALERLKSLRACQTLNRRDSSSGIQVGVSVDADSSSSSSNQLSSRSDGVLSQHTQQAQSYLSAATSCVRTRSSGRDAAAGSRNAQTSVVSTQTEKSSSAWRTTTSAAAGGVMAALRQPSTQTGEELLLRNREQLMQRLPNSSAQVTAEQAEAVQVSCNENSSAVQGATAAVAAVPRPYSSESLAMQQQQQQHTANNNVCYQYGKVSHSSRAPRQACTGEADGITATRAAQLEAAAAVAARDAVGAAAVAAHKALEAAAAVAANDSRVSVLQRSAPTSHKAEAAAECGPGRTSAAAAVDKGQQQYYTSQQQQQQLQQPQQQLYNPLFYSGASDGGVQQQQSHVAAARRSHTGGSDVGSTDMLKSIRSAAAAAAHSTASPSAAAELYGKASASDADAGAKVFTAKASVATSQDHRSTVSSRPITVPSPFSSQQQQQQQQSGVIDVRSPSSDVMVTTRQPSFLISTRPLSEDLDETSCAHPAITTTAAATAVMSAAAAATIPIRAAVGHADASAAAVDAQDKMAFLTTNFASRNNSFTEPSSGAKLLQQQQQQQQQQQRSSCSMQPSTSTWDDLGVLGLGKRGTNVYADIQQQQRSPQRHSSTTTFSRRTRGAAADSDSDVSEMSSSLEQPDSSSDTSDSEDYSRLSTAAAQRRLVGHKVTLGSSISIGSSEGRRSSSCGSGKELEGVCSLGRQKLHTAAHHVRMSGQLPVGCVGLGNLGNTCFLNSILQCLNCLPELVVSLLGRGMLQQLQQRICGADAITAGAGLHLLANDIAVSSPQWRSNAAVGPALRDLFREFWSSQQQQQQQRESWGSGDSSDGGHVYRQQQRVRVVNAVRFLRAVAAADERWGDGCQQDSQEFLHSMLELLQSECNRVVRKPLYKELSGKGTEAQQAAEAEAYARSWHDSLIDDLFGGLLQSTIICSNCNHRSHCFDPFLDLSVPIPRAKQVSLQDCLSAFVEPEVLTGSERVTCSSCHTTCDATKRLQIYTCPKLLVMTLKRFSNNSRGAAGSLAWLGSFSSLSKNQTPVKLDAERVLDLTPYCNPTGLAAAAAKGVCKQPLYELVAVSEHSGCLGGGHYTAHGKNVVDGCWYSFNDSCVMPTGSPCGASSSAYVLFFRMLSSSEVRGCS